MNAADSASNRKAWWPLPVSYLVAWGAYVFAQPPLVQNPTPDDVILGRMVSAVTFGMLLLAGFAAGSVGGLIYKAKERPFPWKRILWASLIIAAAFAVILTFGAWKAHSVLAK